MLLQITIETVARLAEGADGSGGGGDAASDTLTSILLVVAIGGSLLVEGLGEETGRHHATICLPCARIYHRQSEDMARRTALALTVRPGISVAASSTAFR